MYMVFIKYCVFSLKFCDFSELCQFCCSLAFYLPGVCTHTDTKGKQRKARVRNILKSLEKNTIIIQHSVQQLIRRILWDSINFYKNSYIHIYGIDHLLLLGEFALSSISSGLSELLPLRLWHPGRHLHIHLCAVQCRETQHHNPSRQNGL